MHAPTIEKALNRLQQKRHRQAEALRITDLEIEIYQELAKPKKDK